jgi:hypothetical protein
MAHADEDFLLTPLAPNAFEAEIALLAKERGLPVELVRDLFEREFSRLDAAARVKAFVPVITVRLVREALRS